MQYNFLQQPNFQRDICDEKLSISTLGHVSKCIKYTLTLVHAVLLMCLLSHHNEGWHQKNPACLFLRYWEWYAQHSLLFIKTRKHAWISIEIRILTAIYQPIPDILFSCSNLTVRIILVEFNGDIDWLLFFLPV